MDATSAGRGTERPANGPLAAPPSPPPSAALVWCLVAVLCALLLALGAHLGPVTSTETRYAEAGREMVESGDWVIPTLNGGELLEKPPLVYWGMAAAFLVLGVGDVAARVPTLVASLAILALTGFAAGRLARDAADARRRRRLAVLALATSPAFVVLAYAISHDVWLVLATTAAGVALIECARAERPRLGWVLALHASLGVGMLAKGPVVLLLVALPAVAAALLRRDGRLARPLVHPLGLLAFAAVTLPWYLAADARHPGLLRTLVERRLFGALRSDAEFHHRPAWLVWLAIAGTLPWLATLPASLRATRADPSTRRLSWLLLLLALVAPVFFTFSASRLASYAAPSVPWIALVVALGAPASDEARSAWTRALRTATGGAAVVGGGAVAFVLVRYAPAAAVVVVCAALVALSAAVGTGLLVRGLSPPLRAAGTTACGLAAGLLLVGAVPDLVRPEGPLWPPVAALRRPGESMGAALRPNDSWGFLPWKARETVAYFGYPSGLVVVRPEESSPETYRPREELDAWLASPERRWLMLRVKDHGKLASPVWVVSRGPKYEIVTNRPPPGS